jgi:hypothetical protein
MYPTTVLSTTVTFPPGKSATPGCAGHLNAGWCPTTASSCEATRMWVGVSGTATVTFELVAGSSW